MKSYHESVRKNSTQKDCKDLVEEFMVAQPVIERHITFALKKEP